MVTEEKIEKWYERGKVKIETAYEEKRDPKHFYKIDRKKLYDWCMCDYCYMAIKLLPRNTKTIPEGGIMFLPNSLMRRGKVEIAAHNRCFAKLVAEVEKFEREKRIKIVEGVRR